MKNAINKKIEKFFTFTDFEDEEECLNYILYKCLILKSYLTDGFSGQVDITKFDIVYDKINDMEINKNFVFEIILLIQQKINHYKNKEQN